MTDHKTQATGVADAGNDPMPEPLSLAESIPPASIVADFAELLPSLAFQVPGTLSEIGEALSEALPHFDREAG